MTSRLRVLVPAALISLIMAGSPARSALPDIYPSPEQASADIAAALKSAAASHPAIAVLDGHGKLLYSQKTGEFEAMRRMQTGSVTDFLVRWKRPV
jgi:hypothetical protein